MFTRFARGLPPARALGGHYWTLRSHLAAQARLSTQAPSRPWQAHVIDPALGALPLSGLWSEVAGSERALILVHGLGGNAQSAYLDPLAALAQRAGVSTLRLNLRGADLRGADLYHAGLWQDVAAAAASRELARYPELLLAGYSLGGHVALSYALHAREPRLAALIAVCPPLDLALSAQAFDRCFWPYRRHVLSGLKAMFRAVAERQGNSAHWGHLRPRDVAGITSVVQWDERVVAPRHGFASAQDYYQRTSVGPTLGELPCRTAIVSAEQDPMVPFGTVAAALAPHSVVSASGSLSGPAVPRLLVRRVQRAGHLGFPADLDLGFGRERGLAPQLLHFLLGETPSKNAK